MTQKKSYSRYFIILQEDEKGYALASDKLPSGYAKLEIKNDKCKISYYVQNLKKESAPYYMLLICNKKDVKKLLRVGELNIDEHGRAEIFYEYPVENVANLGVGVDKIVGAAIVRFMNSNIIPVMSGFASTDIPEWRTFPVIENEMKRQDENIEAKAEEKVEENAEKPKEEQRNVFDEYEQKIEEEKVKEDVEEKAEVIENIPRNETIEDVNEEEIEVEFEDGRHKKKSKKDCFEINIEAEYKEKKEHDKHKENKCNEEHKENKCNEEHKENKCNEEHKENKCNEEHKENKCNEEHKENKCNEEHKENKCNEEHKENKCNEEHKENKCNEEHKENKCNEEHKENKCNIEHKENKCNEGHHKKHKDEYPKGSVGAFFMDVSDGFEELAGICKEIKRCRWYKVPVYSPEDMASCADYNKYTVAYYPMMNYYPYIRKYGHFILGYKCDKESKIKYLVYGVPGTKSRLDQPYGGRSGFVTWVPLVEGEEDDDSYGYWLMFYDFRNSTIVIPVK